MSLHEIHGCVDKVSVSAQTCAAAAASTATSSLCPHHLRGAGTGTAWLSDDFLFFFLWVDLQLREFLPRGASETSLRAAM